MFNFFKKKREEEERKKSTLDKIVMGAIIGTAIGSVIGLTMAPKKGEDTRGFLKKKLDKAKEALARDRSGRPKKIPHEPHDPSTIHHSTLEDLNP